MIVVVQKNIQYDSIYMSSKSGQDEAMGRELRTVVAFGDVDWKRARGKNVLCFS